MKYTSQQYQLPLINEPLSGLPKDNIWVAMADQLPWHKIERVYNKRLKNAHCGAGNKPARMVVGAMLIKHKLKLSDIATIDTIKENPFMQYLVGLKTFTYDRIFDPSLFVSIRKRLQIEDYNEFTLLLQKEIENEEEEQDNQAQGAGESESKEDTKPVTHKGTLKVDATCCDAEVRYPTDADLLYTANKLIDKIIGDICKHIHCFKPSTKLSEVKERYSKVIKQKNKKKGKLKECIEFLITQLARNKQTALDLIASSTTDRFLELKQCTINQFFTILKLLQQQKEMFDKNSHFCEGKIISIFQPHIRPIIRGKAKSKTEFGAKIGASIINGFTYIDHHSWNAYNECEDLEIQIENYKKRFGYYPEILEGDKIYLNRKNRRYLKSLNIIVGGPALGRKPKDQTLSTVELARYTGERNEIEASFGTAKRVYGANNIRAKLPNTAASWTGACFFIKNVMKFLRELFYALFEMLLYRPSTQQILFSCSYSRS